MKKKLLIAIIFIVSTCAVGAGALYLSHEHTVNTHSGGLDASGCHKNHKTGDYHCHR